MARYRKKPVEIEARQVELVCSDGEVRFTDGTTEVFPMDHEGVYIETLEGRMRFTETHWIITGVKGERYPCKPDIFAATYDPVEIPATYPGSDPT